MPAPKGQGNQNQGNQGRGQGQGPRRHKKDLKTVEFKIYRLASGYIGDLELLATTTQSFRDVFTDGGRPISIAKKCAEEYVRNIGLYGITIEDPEDTFNFYPPTQIAKIVYSIIDD